MAGPSSAVLTCIFKLYRLFSYSFVGTLHSVRKIGPLAYVAKLFFQFVVGLLEKVSIILFMNGFKNA